MRCRLACSQGQGESHAEGHFFTGREWSLEKRKKKEKKKRGKEKKKKREKKEGEKIRNQAKPVSSMVEQFCRV